MTENGMFQSYRLKIFTASLRKLKPANTTAQTTPKTPLHLHKMNVGYVVVYGGNGALGIACVRNFKAYNYWVAVVDFDENKEADLSVVLRQDDTLTEHEHQVIAEIEAALGASKLDAVICVAGGWKVGNAKDELVESSEAMWKKSVWPSLISVTLAVKHLKEGGVFTLPGARAALGSTPEMIGYGMAKAAVHHLTKSLSEKSSGLPEGVVVAAILPEILDTPSNRESMEGADPSSWTPLDFVAQLFLDWTRGKERPNSGALVQLITENFKTDVMPI